MDSKDGKTVLEQRTKKGIWQQLYQFPLIETATSVSKKEFLTQLEMLDEINCPEERLSLFNTSDIIHKLSHQELHIKFWVIKTPNSLVNAVKWSDIKSYPVPVVIERFINNFQI
jgi:A/G-specific adenine glycosylase